MILIGINYGMLFANDRLFFFLLRSSKSSHTKQEIHKHTHNKSKWKMAMYHLQDCLWLLPSNITFNNNNLCVSCIILNENETTRKNSIRLNISDNFDTVRPFHASSFFLYLYFFLFFLMMSAKLLRLQNIFICCCCYIIGVLWPKSYFS